MALVKDIASVAFRLLFPPMEPFETRLFYGWRNLLAATVLFLGGVMAAHIALSFGLVTMFGFTGFAQAQEITALRGQLVQQQQQQMASNRDTMAIVVGGQAFELSTRLCAARKAGNADAEQAYRQQLQGTLDTYERVTGGRRYQVQTCQ